MQDFRLSRVISKSVRSRLPPLECLPPFPRNRVTRWLVAHAGGGLMKKHVVWFTALLLLVAVGLGVWLVCLRSAPHTSGPLAHEAYVWQRAWTAPVRDAVAAHTRDFRQFSLLAAEVTWQNAEPQVVRVPLDYATLRQAGAPVSLVLRVGPFPGPFTGGAPASGPAQSPRDSSRAGSETGAPRHEASAQAGRITLFLGDLALSLVQRAKTNGVSVSELQVDFDCATSKLDGYRVWLEAIQRRVAPLPVTITALPSWLRSPAFKRLAHAATNYVLQVHSVERPASFDAPFTLCDPADAQRAVERAGRIGVPFRVALPTYGYVLAFDKAGKFLGLSAEGPARAWPADAKLREVNSNPLELAALLQTWTARRPAAMHGVIWYRLPVAVDNLNWRWPTLGAMLAARVPRESFRAGTRRVEPGLAELSLVNAGELDISSRLAVEARWSGARLVSGDGQRGFQLVDGGPSAASFQTQTQPCRLPAGESLIVGWLRFDRDCEVKCEVRKF
jgi:hypothetical protein